MDITPLNTPQSKQEPFLVYDFSALDAAGEPVWYFLAVPTRLSEEFIATVNQPGVDVDMKEFGTILASGKGRKAPESVRKEIMEKYADAR